MRVSIRVLGLAAILVLPPGLAAQTSRINSVDPDAAKTGDTVAANGEFLGNTSVEELYLTDGSNDFKVEIIEQTDKLIRFRVPGGMKSGRYALMVKTKAPDVKLIEQPVKIAITATQT